MDNKYMLAHWCYMDNFGDALNPYLLEKLSGKKVLYCNSNKPHRIGVIKYLLKKFPSIKWNDIRLLKNPVLSKPVILSIGSILSRSHSNYLIWGAGFMSNDEQSGGGKVFAVRGKYTAQKLRDEGLSECCTYGDPALLLPLVFHPKQSKKKRIGIVLHWKDKKSVVNFLRWRDCKIIDLEDAIEDVIYDICLCEYILSTSLHGLIVAHAYGIPALWIKLGNIDTDGLKFRDYFSSVGIEEYDGDRFKMDLFIDKKYNEIPLDIRKIMEPCNCLKKIQRDLLLSAPFPVKQQIIDKTAEI